MEFRDLKKQYKVLKDEIDLAIKEVLEVGNYISGSQVRDLEKELAEYVGVKHCICCANGTDALSLALMAWNLSEDDAVFVPDFTFFASGEVISFEGAVPIFVDVDEKTYNMDVAKLEEAIIRVKKEEKLKPKAVIAVDLFGLPANYEEIQEICKKYNLLLLEDGAQGFGGEYKGRKSCSFGDISTTSFFPAKPLGCYGDGGAIFTDNDEWDALIRSYAVHGKGSDKYDNIRIGMNSRLDTIQAAILRVKLKAFVDYELADINKVADMYTEQLQSLTEKGYVLPKVQEGYYSSWAQYTIQLADSCKRSLLQEHLKNSGIPAMIYYIKPMHQQSAFVNTYSASADCSVTERLCETVLSLPIDPYKTKEDVNKVVEIIKAFEEV